MYQINKVKLARDYQLALNKQISKEALNYFEASLAFIQIAYNAGKENIPLTNRFPWIEEKEGSLA